MKNKKLIAAAAVIVAVAAVLGAIKLKRGAAVVETVKEISPSYGTIRAFISTTGTVEPQNRLEIKPSISGRVDQILVEEGDTVETGQIIAWMSSTDRAALLDAARSQGEETLEYWKEVYKPTPLIAPIAGQVIVRAVEPGQTVSSADPVIVLSDRLIVKAQVDETDIGKVKLSQEAAISLDAYPDIKVEGTVDHISYESKTVNNVTIYAVDILPRTVPDVFRSGMSANVDIVEEHKENVLLIPAEAVKQDKEGPFVLLSQGGGKTIRKKIDPGLSDGKNTEVLSGLQEGDTVIISVQKYVPRDKEAGTNPFMPFGRGRVR